MRDLADLMNDALTERSGSLAALPTASVGDRVRRKVRFRRARRYTFEAGGAVAAVAVLGTTAWFGLTVDRHEPAPAVSPTVSTPTPSHTSSPAPTPSATTMPVVLDEIPGLPPTQAMPPGLLERTTPGWVLVIYRSTPSDPSSDNEIYETDPVAHTVVLVSPTGDRYRVVDLPLDTTVHLLSWDAGGTTALVSTLDSETRRAVLDLLTGEITPGDPFDRDADWWYIGRAADGAELWRSFDGTSDGLFRIVDGGAPERVATTGYAFSFLSSVIDATGRWLAVGADDGYAGGQSFVVLDVITGERAEYAYGVDGKECALIEWTGSDTLLAICDVMSVEGAISNATLYRLDVSGGSLDATAVLDLADGEPVPGRWGGMALSGGRTLLRMVDSGPGDPCDSAGVSLWDGHSLTTLEELRPGPDDDSWSVVVGDVAYSGETEACGMKLAAEVTAHDLATGSSLLAPEPAPAGEDHWAKTVTSWLVAGSRLPGVGW